MKKLNNYLFALLILFPIFLNGQAPGYLGKRASVMFNFSGFPALGGPTQNNKGSSEKVYGEGSGWLGLNYEFQGIFSYATGRHTSFSIFVGQFYTGMTSTAYTESIWEDPFSSYSTDTHYLFNRMNVKSIGITYSMFIRGKGALAPVGNRFFMSLKKSFVTSEIVDIDTQYSSDITSLFGHEDLDIDEKVSFHYFLMGWSNSQIYWDRIIFNAGVQIGLPLDYKYFNSAIEGESYYPDYNEDPNQSDYQVNAFDRLFWHELLRINLGVGILLF